MILFKGSSKSTIPFLNRSIVISSKSNGWGFGKNADKASGVSNTLSSDRSIYEIVTDSVIPREWDSYVKNKKNIFECTERNTLVQRKPIGSWRFISGSTVFKALHLYKYEQGWLDIDKTIQALKEDEEYQHVYRSSLSSLLDQSVELSKGLSYWPVPDKREGGNVYDIWSYTIQPGSMYDWSNYWARGVKYRAAIRSDVPYAGFFTHLGELNSIVHIWCYKSLADRKMCREATWQYPEWNDVVNKTVPFVRTMKTGIMEPLDFSPTK